MATRDEARNIIGNFINYFALDFWEDIPEKENLEKYLELNYEENPCVCHTYGYRNEFCACNEKEPYDPDR